MDQSTKDLWEVGAYAAAIATCLAGGTVFLVRAAAKLRSKDRKGSTSFRYPVAVNAGRNILNPQNSSVRMGSTVGMAATVPQGGELMVRLSGAPFVPSAEQGQSLGAMGAWFYSLGANLRNWVDQGYDAGSATSGPAQVFIASQGEAELAIHFERAGTVKLQVFENGAGGPTWEKMLTVTPR